MTLLKELILRQLKCLPPSIASICGENLYMANTKNPYGEAVQAWFNEIKDWEYGKGSINGKAVGHFT